MTPTASDHTVLPLIAVPSPAVEPSPRWVRVKFGGAIIADSKRVLLLRQYGSGRLPTYCFPAGDVRTDLLEPAAAAPQGAISLWNIRVADQFAGQAAWTYLASRTELAALQGYIGFDWSKMEAWFEEEEEVFAHARDPYHRVDVLASSRHVRIVIGGVTVAETRRPFLLFETSLPTRYYIPRSDVRMDLLTPSSLTSVCPYKGIAAYWSVQVGDAVAENVAENIVWSYPQPILENPKIKDLMCFYNERVDLYVDDELQSRPHTPWSAPVG